jgi:spore germination protein GerM
MKRVILMLLSVTVIVGCGASVPIATVPTTGPIEQGPQVGVAPEGQFIRVIARPPRPGMTRAQVVQGFLDASASFDSDHAVARQYLTPQANQLWNPNLGVSVYEGLTSLNQDAGQVVFRANQSGRITDIGRFEVVTPGTEIVAEFSMASVNGEWRISEPPPGLLLSSADVDRAFRSYALYYFNPAFEILVPDARLIPVFGPGRATTLVRLLLEGPNAWLAPAVRSGFPANITLGVESVPVESGIAKVELSPSAQLASDQIRRAMAQQLVWTLRQLPDVSAISISAGGQPLRVPGALDPEPRDAWPAVDPAGMFPGSTGYVSQPGRIERLVFDGARPVAGAAGDSDLSLVDIAVSRSGRVIAGTDADGQVWSTALQVGQVWQQIPDVQGATGIAFDRSGAFWFVDPTRGLLAAQPDGSVAPISIIGLAKDLTVTAAYPSRDGTRAALVIRESGRTSLLIARVLRGAPDSATDIVLSSPIRVESRLTEVIDLAWAGSNSLLVLGSEGAGILQVFEVDLARGVVRQQGSPDFPLAIAAAPGLPTLALNADGVVFELDAGSWIPRATGIAVTYPN